jgi:transcriptional regulator of acetoin/glycerol metabolism
MIWGTMPPADPTPVNKTPMMLLIEMQTGQQLEKLIPILLDKHDTVKQAAEEINIGEATLWRWMKDFGFQTKHMEVKESYRQQRRKRGRKP